MSSFSGTTDDQKRNTVQQRLSQSIGNDSTRPRSIEIAIRVEASLFDRLGKRADSVYSTKVDEMVASLTDSNTGFEMNRRLLCGELAPERWVEDCVPQRRAELAKTSSTAAAATTASANNSTAPAPSTSSSTPSSAPSSSPTSANKADEDDDQKQPQSSPSATEDRKGLKSNYYFFSSTPAEQAAQYRPKPIDPSTVQKVESSAPAGGSKWNTGGTWEERDLSKWAQQRLREVLRDLPVPAFADGQARISNEWTVSGEASSVFTRGKKKIGYELSAKGSFSGEYRGQRVDGTLEMPTIEPDDDITLKVYSSGSGEAAEVVRRAVSKVKDEFVQRVEKFIEEMRSQ